MVGGIVSSIGVPVSAASAEGSVSMGSSAGAGAEERSIATGAPSTEGVQGLIRAGRYSEAEGQARELLHEADQIYGPESMQSAEVLDLLAEAMRNAGHAGVPEAREVCERAVRLKEKLAGKNSAAYAASLHNLGALYMSNGDYARARALLQETLAIRERLLGRENPDVARTLLFLANVEGSQGRDQVALPLVERADAIQRRFLAPDDPERARATNMLAVLRYNLGDFTTPASLWEEVLSARRKLLGADHPLVAETLHNLGALATQTGDYDQALRYLEEARAIRQARLGPDNTLLASTLVVMGMALQRAGDLPRARARYEEALRIQELPQNKNKSELAWILRILGDLLVQRHEDARAKRLLYRAQEIQERELGPDGLDMGWTLGSLAVVAEHEGRRADAEALYRHALRIQQAAYGASSPDVVQTETQFARFLVACGDSARAFSIALDAARARADHLRSTAAGLSERQALAYEGSESQPLDVVLALAAGEPDRVPAAWDALIRSRTIVLDEIAARHGAAIAGPQDSATAAPRGELDAARRRFANLLVRGIGADDPERYRSLIEHAREDVESAERALASKSARFGAAMRREAVGWKEVSSALPDGWGLVAFALHGSGRQRCYTAFVGSHGRPPVAIPLGRADTIDRLALGFVGALGRGDRSAAGGPDRGAEAECRAAGASLRRRIWNPIAAPLRGLDRVFVVPEGSLHLVNFAALPSGPGTYLVENGPLLQYLSAERDLVRLPRREGHGLLALGGASFDAPEDTTSLASVVTGSAGQPDQRRSLPGSRKRGPQPECDEFRNARFAPLPETGREVQEVASEWRDPSEVVTLLGARAGERSFKRLAPGRKVLHLATHGFFLDATHCSAARVPSRARAAPRDQIPSRSGVRSGSRGIGGIGVAGAAAPARTMTQPPRRSSPLLVSGLALAGANRRLTAKPDDEDGVLMAQEVVSLDLSSTDWVVLSACDTGLGKVQAGEGVLGLRRAFQAAGAGSVIMSLWEVEDRSSREWMRNLYVSRFRLGRSTPEAVRDADLAVLRDRRAQGLGTHPFYWAGFVATGDWK